MCPASNKWDIYNSQAEANVLERWKAEIIPDLLGELLATTEASELCFHLIVSETLKKQVPVVHQHSCQDRVEVNCVGSVQ